MPLPFVIDNRDHKLADELAELLLAGAGCPLGMATAYFAISGYRLVREVIISQVEPFDFDRIYEAWWDRIE